MRPRPAAPNPMEAAAAVRPEVEALLAEGKIQDAIARVNAKVDENATEARRPLLEAIAAAADADERRRGQAIEALLDDGKLDEAEEAITTGRRALPTTFAGARFKAQAERLERLRRVEQDPNWAQAYRDHVDPAVLDGFGRQAWKILRAAVARYFADPAARADAVKTIESVVPPRGVLRAAIAVERPRPPRSTGEATVVRRELKIPASRLLGRAAAGDAPVTVSYVLAVPKLPQRGGVPLLVDIFSPMTTPEEIAKVERTAKRAFDLMGEPGIGPFAYAVPLGIEGLEWWGGGLEIARAVVRDVKERVLPIDSRRVYLSGFDVGAGACWRLALEHPTAWAAIGPTAGPFAGRWTDLLGNARHLGVYAVHRAGDPVFPAAAIRKATETMRQEGHEAVVYSELPGDEHAGETPEELVRKLRWMFERSRPTSPRTLRYAIARPVPTRLHWVRALAYRAERKTVTETRETRYGKAAATRFVAPAQLEVVHRGSNHVDIVHAEGVSRVEVLISRDVFELDLPVRITQGAKVLFRSTVTPRAADLLALAAEFPDEDIVARVVVEPSESDWTDRLRTRLPQHLIDGHVKAFGRAAFTQLLEELPRVLQGPAPDAGALRRIEGLAPSHQVLDAALLLAHQPLNTPPGNHRFDLELPTHKLTYFMHMPPLQPAQRAVLVIDLHGGGGGGDHLRQQLEMFSGMSMDLRTPIIGVLPSSVTRLRWGPSRPGIEQIHSVVRDVMKRAPVDTSRIYLGGFSMGGFGAWMTALDDPTLFAAIQPTAARFMPFMKPLLPNLDNLGVYFVHQTGDPIVPIDGARLANEALKARKHPLFVYDEVQGNEHGGEPPAAARRKLRWLLSRRRNVSPQQIIARSRMPRIARRYYLRLMAYDPQRATGLARLPGIRGTVEERWFRAPAGLTVQRVAPNTYAISEVAGVTKIELLLGPDEMDFTRPLVVRRGEQVLFEGKIEPTITGRLHLAREFPDGRYRARLALDLPPAPEQPADEQPADEQPADEQPADEQPADEQPADEQPADEQPADEQPADEKPADEQPADEKPDPGEEPSDEKPADAPDAPGA